MPKLSPGGTQLFAISAVDFLRLAVGCMLLAIGLAIAGFVLLLIPHGVPFGALAGVMLALLSGTIVFYLLGRAFGICEARSGYTTLTNRYRELPQIHPRSGRVIRPAGQPYIAARLEKRGLPK